MDFRCADQKDGLTVNLDHLRYFKEIAELEHYGLAARALHITQPSLTYAIGQLESELGVSLFEKSGRNVCLTRYGKLFLDSVKTSLDHLDNGVRTLQELSNGGGMILLGGIQELATALIPGLMKGFLEKTDDATTRFELHTESSFSADLLDALDKNRIDIAFVSIPGDTKVFESHPFSRDPFVLIVPKGHPIAKRKSITLNECEPYPFIGFSKRAGLYSYVEKIFVQADFAPDIVYTTEEVSVIAGMVESGFGISVVSDAPVLECFDIVTIPITGVDTSRTAYLCRKRLASHPAAADRFYDYCLGELEMIG